MPLTAPRRLPTKPPQPGDDFEGPGRLQRACARCHGSDAQHPGPAGSILNGSFLALIDPQTIRTTVIAGRPDIGEPDWRNHIPGRPMTGDEIANVTAWLLAQRPAAPGQPYPNDKPDLASARRTPAPRRISTERFRHG